MYTEDEARALAIDAAQEALTRFAASRPVPTAVSASEAATMLGVSVRTVARMKLPRNRAGKIPYQVVLDALDQTEFEALFPKMMDVCALLLHDMERAELAAQVEQYASEHYGRAA